MDGLYFGLDCKTAQWVVCIIATKSSMLLFFRAQSGTGKTATFSIAILQGLDTQIRETQALVLSPTRELANQIQKVLLIYVRE